MTTTSEFTPREIEIINILNQRFEGHALSARVVNVNKLEGGEEATVRFTLDDVSSTDFSRDRIAGNEPVEDLAAEAADELENPVEPIGP